jgi:hypothetical protein
MDGNDMLEYEEKHFDRLVNAFIEKHADLWAEFVMDDWQDREADRADYLYEMVRDRR